MDEYHDNGQFGYGFDISKYDAAFFQKKALLFVFANVYGSVPAPINLSINDSGTETVIKFTRPDEPVTPDMASWMLVLEMDRDMPEKEVWLNGEKVAEAPYATSIEHDYRAAITQPTCTEAGFTTHTCACGDSYQDAAVPALGHSFGEWTDSKAATCTEKGEQNRACTRCEAKETRETDALGHDFKDGVCTRCEAKDPDYEEPVVEPFRFDDVKDDKQFYYEPVYWAVDQKITKGTSKKLFSPDDGCTRAQVVTFLWRAAGEPEPTKAENPFMDVKETDYFYKAVAWAVEKGITKGTSADKFSPDATCTRAQIVTFLYRAEGTPEISRKSKPFSDVDAAQYYADAVAWAVENGITTGKSADTFAPNVTCTRGEIVTFLYRCAGKE